MQTDQKALNSLSCSCHFVLGLIMVWCGLQILVVVFAQDLPDADADVFYQVLTFDGSFRLPCQLDCMPTSSCNMCVHVIWSFANLWSVCSLKNV